MFPNFFDAFADELHKIAAKAAIPFDKWVSHYKRTGLKSPRKQPADIKGMEGMGIPEVGSNRRLEPNRKMRRVTMGKKATIIKDVKATPPGGYTLRWFGDPAVRQKA